MKHHKCNIPQNLHDELFAQVEELLISNKVHVQCIQLILPLQIDRSPTGSGVTARLAVQYKRGLIGLQKTRVFESGATGGTFTGSVVKETTFGEFDAVVAEVSGTAHYTGSATFTAEDDDDLKDGFLLK